MLETANFRGDDVDCLVCASLACASCLSSDVDWVLLDEAHDARAACECRACGGAHTVFLTPAQTLRLALHAERPLDAALAGDGLGAAH